jgi:hypothetical protein
MKQKQIQSIVYTNQLTKAAQEMQQQRIERIQKQKEE